MFTKSIAGKEQAAKEEISGDSGETKIYYIFNNLTELSDRNSGLLLHG